jgi:hypothetical protein
MDSVIRAAAIYGALLVLFRITGNRSLGPTRSSSSSHWSRSTSSCRS